MNIENLKYLRRELQMLAKGKKEVFGTTWQFDMGSYCSAIEAGTSATALRPSKHACGTAACIAGLAVALKIESGNYDDIQRQGTAEKDEGSTPFDQVESIAAHWLGLEYKEALQLFVPMRVDGWEDATPAEAVDAIDDVLAGRDPWSTHPAYDHGWEEDYCEEDF